MGLPSIDLGLLLRLCFVKLYPLGYYLYVTDVQARRKASFSFCVFNRKRFLFMLAIQRSCFFSVSVAGLVVFSRPQVFYRQTKVATTFLLAPMVGSALWVFAYQSYKLSWQTFAGLLLRFVPFKTITSINPRSLLS